MGVGKNVEEVKLEIDGSQGELERFSVEDIDSLGGWLFCVREIDYVIRFYRLYMLVVNYCC